MPTKTWLDVDGDWTNANNWQTTNPPGANAVPIDADDVVIQSGSKSITSNLNQSAINLKSLSITSGYTGNIGTNGTSLQINVDHGTATLFRVSMGGQYIYWNGTTTVDLTIGSTGSGGFYMTGGSFSGVKIVGGATGLITIASGITMGDLYSAGAGFDVSSAFTNALFMGGNHAVRAGVTNLTLGANVGCTTRAATVNISNAYLHRGSRLTTYSGGTLGTVNAYPGSNFVNGGSYDNTITNLYQWIGSTQVLNAPNAVTTVTTTVPTGSK